MLGKPFQKDGEKLMHFSCLKLGIQQDFLIADIPELILDLPNIVHNLKQSTKQDTFLRVRIKVKEKEMIEKKAISEGKTTSAYIREKVLSV